jgi:predicted  nucleic acid-binding Zn-ribbon protein
MVVVNLILAVLFLSSAGTLHSSAESWQKRHDIDVKAQKDINDALEAQLKAKTAQHETAVSEARSLDAGKQAAEAQLKQLNDSSAVLQRELDTKNGEITKLQSNLTDQAKAISDLTARNEQLSTQVSQNSSDLKQTQEKLATSQENLTREAARADTAEKALAAAEATNKTQWNDLDAANTLVAAYNKKFGPLPGAIEKALTGVIQAGDAKADVFIVSLGSNDGVKIGYEFTVSRGSNYVSTIVIDAVFPQHASGHTKAGMKKSDVQPGDRATTPSAL